MVVFFSIFRPHLNSACAAFRVKRVNLHLWNDVQQIYNWGECSEPHTCGENGKLSIYIYVYICICLVRAYSVYIYILPHLCAMQYFHIDCNHWHCCSRDKTSRTERLNSGNQRNRDLKTVRIGRHYYQDRG